MKETTNEFSESSSMISILLGIDSSLAIATMASFWRRPSPSTLKRYTWAQAYDRKFTLLLVHFVSMNLIRTLSHFCLRILFLYGYLLRSTSNNIGMRHCARKPWTRADISTCIGDTWRHLSSVHFSALAEEKSPSPALAAVLSHRPNLVRKRGNSINITAFQSLENDILSKYTSTRQ